MSSRSARTVRQAGPGAAAPTCSTCSDGAYVSQAAADGAWRALVAAARRCLPRAARCADRRLGMGCGWTSCSTCSAPRRHPRGCEPLIVGGSRRACGRHHVLTDAACTSSSPIRWRLFHSGAPTISIASTPTTVQSLIKADGARATRAPASRQPRPPTEGVILFWCASTLQGVRGGYLGRFVAHVMVAGRSTSSTVAASAHDVRSRRTLPARSLQDSLALTMPTRRTAPSG